MAVYQMRTGDPSFPRVGRVDFVHAHSLGHALAIARSLGYWPNSVALVPEEQLKEISPESIVEVDPGVLIATSRLVTKPITTIMWGVVWGILVTSAISFLIAMLLLTR